MSLSLGLRFQVCLFITITAELSATITQGPSNAVAKNGAQVILNCVATDPIGYWYLSKNGVVTDEMIIAGPGCLIRPEYVDHFAVEQLGGGTTCNLIVFSITMAQAGVYRCLEGPFEYLSILTVIDSSPVISFNSSTIVVENESVLIECVLNHSGSSSPAPTLRPYFYWTDCNGLNVSSSYDSTTDNTAVSKIAVTAGLQDIIPYTCQVYLLLTSATNPNYAGNTPTVNKGAGSPIIEVILRGQVAGPNAIALINGQTMLDCTTNDLSLSNWRHTPDGNNNYLIISVGCNPVTGSNAAYYRTEVVGGNICRLIMANVTMQQAGVYSCYDGSTTVYQCLVTVIDPVASIVVYNRSEIVEGDQLNISCSISYTGPASPAPSLRPSPYWTTSSGQIFTSATCHASVNVVALLAVVTVQKPTVPVFQCNTVFEITGSTIGYNPTPPPDHFTVGRTKEIDVQYIPSAPVISSRPEVIAINGVSCGISVLTCSSDGNPIPNYRWYDTAENVTLSTTNILTLAEVNRNYKCKVDNTIRDEEYNASTTYTVSKDSCTSTVLKCCVFPRNETTSVAVKSFDNETVCDCSQGYSGIILTCNATTFPNASYMWTGPNAVVIYSPIHDNITKNGVYVCTTYFNEALTNYTGDVKFSNGTNETTVGQCAGSSSLLWPAASDSPSLLWPTFLIYMWSWLDFGRCFL